MERILLSIEHQENRRLLSQWLSAKYEVLSPEADFKAESEKLLSQTFDLCFIDYAAVEQLRHHIVSRREAEAPIFLPFVFLTSRQNIGLSTDGLESIIDDIIHLPIEKIELRTKLKVLLRSRFHSLELQKAREKLNLALLQEKELNQLKSRFVSTVSHEFRNPLNSISGMAQILEAYGDSLSSTKKKEVLQQLRRNIIRMTNLLDNVLIVSRKDMGKLQFNPAPLELEIFCRSLVDEIQMVFNNQQTIDFFYRGKQQQFKLDSKLLHHVLTNLLSNAYKYSAKDTRIDFTVSFENSQIIFTIEDRGIGIPPADIPKLFDSFYRASNSEGYQGTGLGLAIAKEYVELHQGTISVQSKLDVGTIFTVVIPAT